MIIAGIDIGILTMICALLLVGVIWLTIKLVKRLIKKKDWQYQVVAIVLLLAILGVAGYFEGKQQYINYLASDITHQVIGREDVSAKCVRTLGDSLDINQYGSAHGWAKVGGTYSKLDRTTCKNFYEWWMSDRKHAALCDS